MPVADDLFPRQEGEAPSPSPAPALEARISPLYGNGECYIVLEGSRAVLGGGTLLASWVSDTQGFRECSLLNLSKRRRQEFWQE